MRPALAALGRSARRPCPLSEEERDDPCERSSADCGQAAGIGGSGAQRTGVRPRQSRQSVRRLKAVASSVHSASTSLN